MEMYQTKANKSDGAYLPNYGPQKWKEKVKKKGKQ
jgi:hypothetical protein